MVAVDPTVRAEAVALVAAGESCNAVARRLGVAKRSVSVWARAAGLVLQTGPVGGVVGSDRRPIDRRRPRPPRPPRPRKPLPWKRGGPPVDPARRAQAVALVEAGESCSGAARRLGLSPRSVSTWVRLAGMSMQMGPRGGVAVVACGEYVDGNGRLTHEGRMLIAIRWREPQDRRPSMRRIAAELGVDVSTVSREVARGSVDGAYRAQDAQQRAERARRRPKASKLGCGTALRAQVVARLNDKHSPEQIARRLRLDFAGRDEMQVSHETIYQALYVQGAGGLRHELGVEKALRQGHTRRRPRSKLARRTNRSWIGNATISTRPAAAADRAVPGHWEGDLVIGGDLRSALITLNERHTRFTLIRRIDVHDTTTVTDQLIEMTRSLPQELWESLTWDQGVEMADHARFSIAADCPVFFCDPHSPWQRPTNENGNGLIRDFYPKGTDFTTVTDDDIAHMQRLLNTRPRKVLSFATPAETLNQLITVATTS